MKNRVYTIWQVLFSMDLASAWGSFASFFAASVFQNFIDGSKYVLRCPEEARHELKWFLFVCSPIAGTSTYPEKRASIRAAIVDDTIKHRRGDRVSVVSNHFDQTWGQADNGPVHA